MLASIQALAQADPAVESVLRSLTMYLGPHEVLLNLDVQFHYGLSTIEVETAVDRLERIIRRRHPEVTRIFIEAETISGRSRTEVR
jgi:divalent metal cation (Fe/Co/Zn/Cd) transporter